MQIVQCILMALHKIKMCCCNQVELKITDFTLMDAYTLPTHGIARRGRVVILQCVCATSSLEVKNKQRFSLLSLHKYVPFSLLWKKNLSLTWEILLPISEELMVWPGKTLFEPLSSAWKTKLRQLWNYEIKEKLIYKFCDGFRPGAGNYFRFHCNFICVSQAWFQSKSLK